MNGPLTKCIRVSEQIQPGCLLPFIIRRGIGERLVQFPPTTSKLSGLNFGPMRSDGAKNHQLSLGTVVSAKKSSIWRVRDANITSIVVVFSELLRP